MTQPLFGRRNITILASVFLLAICLFGWVGIGHMQKQSPAQTSISESPALGKETKDRPAAGEGRIMYANGRVFRSSVPIRTISKTPIPLQVHFSSITITTRQFHPKQERSPIYRIGGRRMLT